MTGYVTLLRAVNVGRTGKLAMTELKALCEAAGFQAVQTYIASGNVVFTSAESEPTIKATLEARLRDHLGQPVGVLVRTAAELAKVLAENPFPDSPGSQVMAIFLDVPAVLDGMVGRAENEEVRLGRREIYVRYGNGMGRTKLRIPAAEAGTARNMNTVAKLVAMAED
jgi:uncharacterized protein (DUF1697 family)